LERFGQPQVARSLFAYVAVDVSTLLVAPSSRHARVCVCVCVCARFRFLYSPVWVLAWVDSLVWSVTHRGYVRVFEQPDKRELVRMIHHVCMPKPTAHQSAAASTGVATVVASSASTTTLATDTDAIINLVSTVYRMCMPTVIDVVAAHGFYGRITDEGGPWLCVCFFSCVCCEKLSGRCSDRSPPCSLCDRTESLLRLCTHAVGSCRGVLRTVWQRCHPRRAPSHSCVWAGHGRSGLCGVSFKACGSFRTTRAGL